MNFLLNNKLLKTDWRNPRREAGIVPLTYSVTVASNKGHELPESGLNSIMEIFEYKINPAEYACFCMNWIEVDDNCRRPPVELADRIILGVDRFEVYIVNDK